MTRWERIATGLGFGPDNRSPGSSTVEPTSPGWYPDPEQVATQRYWDGQAWTEQRAPMASQGANVSTQKLITGVGLGVLAAAGGIWFVLNLSQPSESDCNQQRIDAALNGTTVEPACS